MITWRTRTVLTRREWAVLRFLRGYAEAKGHGPFYREIGRAVGAVKSGVNRDLSVLARLGYVRRLPGKHCAIEVLTDIPIPRSPEGEPLYFVAMP